MSYALLEIVQLENGDVVLRRSDDDKQVLLTLQFSEEINEQLEGVKLEVAKAMIQGGAGAFADLMQAAESPDEAMDQPVTPVYH